MFKLAETKVYPYIHQSCPNGRCVLPNYSRTSVEKDVHELDSSIPIIRVEVGYLSLYQNRAWIERDFSLPSNERQIPYMLANALLEFLGKSCTLQSLCGEERPPVENKNYSNSESAKKVTEDIIGSVESRSEVIIEAQSYVEEGLVLDTTPPIVIPTSVLSNVQTLDTYEGITVTPYITGNEEITFTLPVDWLYRMSALLSASGGITTVTPLSFTTSLSVPTQFLDMISMTMEIGTCHGLMTWLSRYCAGMEPLGTYDVVRLDQLDVNNAEFMQRVMWLVSAHSLHFLHFNVLERSLNT